MNLFHRYWGNGIARRSKLSSEIESRESEPHHTHPPADMKQLRGRVFCFDSHAGLGSCASKHARVLVHGNKNCIGSDIFAAVAHISHNLEGLKEIKFSPTINAIFFFCHDSSF